MDGLIVLQNAWSAEWAGRRWPRRLWLEALRTSRAGVRLRALTAAAADIRWEYGNTTAAVAAAPHVRLPPCLRHVRRSLRRVEPDVVVACGRQAIETLTDVWDGPLIGVPHPAARLVTDSLYREAAALALSAADAYDAAPDFPIRVVLGQGRDGTMYQPALPGEWQLFGQ